MKTREVIEHIEAWLDQYADEAGSRGFVVGVSGGIDSAVTSALAAETGRPTTLVTMPIHQPADQVSRARRHIDALSTRADNVASVQVELTDVFDTFVSRLPDIENAEPDDDRHHLLLANARARLRMSTLYYVAARDGDLVVGTGNKVEDFGIGFFTKYGDGGVDLSPIADLDKTEVYAVGKALGIDEEIMSAAPTDGLWSDGRTDEDQIGASYPELEWAMKFTGSEEGLDERERAVLEIYRGYRRQNRHKMVPIPVCEIPDAWR